MLRAAGVEFTAIPADVDEMAIKLTERADGATPARIAESLASAKAIRVAIGYPQDLIIGADQILAMDAEMFDKPVDTAAARAQLRSLSGRDHTLHSAVCLVRGNRVVWRHTAAAALTMRDFSDSFLDRYLAAMGPAVCESVGGYQIEGLGVQLFSRISGDHFTIRGMPLLPLLDILRQEAILDS